MHTKNSSLKCKQCANEFNHLRVDGEFCTEHCRWNYHNAKRNKIKLEEKTKPLNDQLIEIANEKKQDVDFIKRLHASCMMVGFDFDFDLALRRYCDNDKTITIPSTLIDAHKKLMDEHFRSGRKN